MKERRWGAVERERGWVGKKGRAKGDGRDGKMRKRRNGRGEELGPQCSRPIDATGQHNALRANDVFVIENFRKSRVWVTMSLPL